MKEFFGTIIIVALAFLAGLLAFWFRKFLLAGVALALLLSGCDGGSEGDPNDPNSPDDSVNTFACPVPSVSTFAWPHPYLLIEKPVTCDASMSPEWLPQASIKGLSCHDIVTDDSAFEKQVNSNPSPFVGEVGSVQCGVLVSTHPGSNSNIVTETGVACTGQGPIGYSSGLAGFSCSDSRMYPLCSTSGSFQGWACLNSPNS
jgi:hypothetical protein